MKSSDLELNSSSYSSAINVCTVLPSKGDSLFRYHKNYHKIIRQTRKWWKDPSHRSCLSHDKNNMVWFRNKNRLWSPVCWSQSDSVLRPQQSVLLPHPFERSTNRCFTMQGHYNCVCLYPPPTAGFIRHRRLSEVLWLFLDLWSPLEGWVGRR